VWTEEDLRSERAEAVQAGWFGTTERQVFALQEPKEQGVSALARSVVLPARPYQALVELDPPAFRSLRKYVVGEGGKLLNVK
jgi:hypothetical protein